MKKTSIIMILFVVCTFGFAQNDKFMQAMLTNSEKAKTLQTITDYQDIANSYERIALSEKNQWTPYYYAAFYNLMINFRDSVAERKVNYLQLAQKQIEEGLKIKPEETELTVIKILSYFGEMSLDPMKGMELMPKVNQLIEQAKAVNPDNPRIYLQQAEAIYNTPPEFGGGKEKAQTILLVAKEKFDKFVPSDLIAPNWGKERCEMLLAECQKTK